MAPGFDPYPIALTGVDYSDPAQRAEWITRTRAADADQRRTARGRPATPPARGSTKVVGIRLTLPECEAIERAARRHAVWSSDLVRRWIRDGLEEELQTLGDERDAGVADAVRAQAERTLDRVADDLARVRASNR